MWKKEGRRENDSNLSDSATFVNLRKFPGNSQPARGVRRSVCPTCVSRPFLCFLFGIWSFVAPNHTEVETRCYVSQPF